VTAATLFHHRDPHEIEVRYPKPFSRNSWADPVASLCCVSEDVLEGLWRWIDLCAGSWIEKLRLSEFGVSPISLVPLEEAMSRFTEGFANRLRKRLDNAHRWARMHSLPQQVKEALGSIIVRGQVISCDHLASAHATKLLHPAGGPRHLLSQWNDGRGIVSPPESLLGLTGFRGHGGANWLWKDRGSASVGKQSSEEWWPGAPDTVHPSVSGQHERDV
jgi:hypothetical protein